MERFYHVTATGQLKGMCLVAQKQRLVSTTHKVSSKDFIEEFIKDFDDLWSIDVRFSLKYTLMNILCPKRLGKIIREERP